LVDAYTGETTVHNLQPHDVVSFFSDRHKFFGWYDFTLTADADPSFVARLPARRTRKTASPTRPSASNELPEMMRCCCDGAGLRFSALCGELLD